MPALHQAVIARHYLIFADYQYGRRSQIRFKQDSLGFFHYLYPSPSASDGSWTQTLDIGMMWHVFYHCFTSVLPLFYRCSIAVLLLFYHYSLLFYHSYCRATTVLPLYYHCATTVLPLFYHCATTVLPLFYHCTTPVLPPSYYHW